MSFIAHPHDRPGFSLQVIFASFLMLSTLMSFSALSQSASFSELAANDIQANLHADEYELIDVSDSQIPIFITHSEQALTKGIIFILGDADTPLGRSDSLHLLAQKMPQYGWTVVSLPSLGLSLGPSIAFPVMDKEEIKEAVIDASSETETTLEVDAESATALIETPKVLSPSSSKRFQEAISEAQLVIYNKEIEAYMSAAFKHMQGTLGHRVIISQGISAASITKLLADQNPIFNEVDAAVIHNPYWPMRKLNLMIPSIVAQTTTPMLDLTSQWDNAWSIQTQKQRKIKARTELKELYRQADIIGQPMDDRQAEYVAKLIKGWTTYLGW
ncbi:DUF3530 family protein [Glaciecola sp. MH2013]|uniref:DUF3530 family protein n=1 Tax=Glaciecola sp. MH2013 TaxID=2785524 RepID=UPI00189D32FF|nr:DUF3530 family protein [Glaciecola sp. MH2013]MBF7073869.1 DUF3530 family protein [Glaciecola sp. MH2013]